MPTNDIADAVKDTVLINQRQRVGRSQTSAGSQYVYRLISSNSSTHFFPLSLDSRNDNARPLNGRSQSQDSGTPNDKAKSSATKSRSKKGSQHADVIDRLDFTGVGPSKILSC
jgi:hypothetical protein